MVDQEDRCSTCKRERATRNPGIEQDFERDDNLCYDRLQGRSRRAERNCLWHTIRSLKDRVTELEEWQTNVRLTHKVDGVQLVRKQPILRRSTVTAYMPRKTPRA